jgi:hypothetical protein
MTTVYVAWADMHRLLVLHMYVIGGSKKKEIMLFSLSAMFPVLRLGMSNAS